MRDAVTVTVGGSVVAAGVGGISVDVAVPPVAIPATACACARAGVAGAIAPARAIKIAATAQSPALSRPHPIARKNELILRATSGAAPGAARIENDGRDCMDREKSARGNPRAVPPNRPPRSRTDARLVSGLGRYRKFGAMWRLPRRITRPVAFATSTPAMTVAGAAPESHRLPNSPERHRRPGTSSITLAETRVRRKRGDVTVAQAETSMARRQSQDRPDPSAAPIACSRVVGVKGLRSTGVPGANCA